MWKSALSTRASGVGSPNRCRRCFSSEPAFTPIRMGTLRSAAALVTSCTRQVAPMLPGLIRRQSTPAVEALEGQPVIEVDVHDQRDADLGSDLADRRRGVRVGDRHPHDLAAGRLQRPDLVHRRLDVPRVGLGHGLDRDGRVPADRHLAHLERARPPPDVGAGGCDAKGGDLGERAEVRRFGRIGPVLHCPTHGWPSQRKMSL